ncbi:MAG: cytochrome b [Proteobacteria bacterium]|nr:cytochrome b [Pseudomonadota bacterium]
MPMRNDRARWGAVSQTFHWLIVAMILAQAVLALLFKRMHRGPEAAALIGVHKSFGMTILVLAALRLLWRWANPVPDLPGTLKSHERFLARFSHGALYALLFAMPLTGWLGSSALGFAVRWFNLFSIPDPLGKDRALGHALYTTHSILALALGLILVLHIAAAVRHHWVLKDDVLRRMWPGCGVSRAASRAAPHRMQS